MSDWTVGLITAERTRPLRKRVLRPNFSEPQLVFPGDEQDSTFHVGTLINDEVVGIMTVMRDPHPMTRDPAWRIRGMATAPEHQGSGFGRAMIEHGCREAWSRSNDAIWCNAREIAFGFYEKLGFTMVGELFEIDDIGVHSVMVIQPTDPAQSSR